MGPSECQSRCTADSTCMCATFRRSDRKCWKRKDCEPSGWTSDFNDGYNVYLKRDSPSPAPAPAPAPSQGSYVMWAFDETYCMSVDSNAFQNGQKMQLWKCSGSNGQMFQFDTSSNSPSLLRASAAPEYCVVIDGNKNSNEARIQLWECEMNEQAQYWTREWVCASNVKPEDCAQATPELRALRGDSLLMRNTAFPDKCLAVDLPSLPVSNGQQLQLYGCSEAAQQYQTWKHYGL